MERFGKPPRETGTTGSREAPGYRPGELPYRRQDHRTRVVHIRPSPGTEVLFGWTAKDVARPIPLSPFEVSTRRLFGTEPPTAASFLRSTERIEIRPWSFLDGQAPDRLSTIDRIICDTQKHVRRKQKRPVNSRQIR